MSTPDRVLGVVTSGKPQSRTAWLVSYWLERMAELEVAVDMWDLAERPLPIANPLYHHDAPQHPDERVRDFHSALQAADGVLFATPVYHGTYTGIFKNALDSVDSECLAGKPTAVLAFGKNLSGVQACSDMRGVLRSLWSSTLILQAAATREDVIETGPERVISDQLAERFASMVVEMSWQLQARRSTPALRDMFR